MQAAEWRLTDSPLRRSAGLCLGSCRDAMVYGMGRVEGGMRAVRQRSARRINKTIGIRDIRAVCESSMSCLAGSIEGWRVLDDAGEWVMLMEIRGRAAT